MDLILQILSFLSMLSVFVIILWRVLGNSGVSLKKTLPEIDRETGFLPDVRDCARIFGFAMLFRLFILGLSFIIYCIFVEQAASLQWHLFLDNWIKWDANAYIRISEGYTSYMENGHYPTLVFFPLYAWLLKALRLVIPNAAAAGLFLSGLLSSFACMYLFKLVCLDYSRKTALLSVLFLCIFPFGFFYSAIMSESVFLLTSIMTLYYIRKGNWGIGGICGFFAALSRSAGVFLVFPALVQLLEESKLLGKLKNGKLWAETLKKGLWILLLPLATLLYLFINYRISGDPFYFLELEKMFWQQETQAFFQTAGSFWEIITGPYSPSVVFSSFLPGLICLIFSYIVLLRSATKHKTMYVTWLFVSIIVNTSMTWPLSFCRYIACAFPLYIFMADECENKPKLKLGLIVCFCMLFGIYLTGYLMTKQIM